MDNLDSATAINFNLKIDNVDNLLDKNGEINFFRIIQECINNVVKHSHADFADIIIKNRKNDIAINISDNGRGFDINNNWNSSDPGSGFGLNNLRKRVEILEGKIEINSYNIPGTEIKIIIPIK